MNIVKTSIRDDILLANNPREATRDGYGRGLVRAAKRDPGVVALCADLSESTRTDAFQKLFPDRYIEMGVSEQSMASVASGMAAMGNTAFVASYAMFSPGRNWEQIRTTICYNNTNVKIVGAHAGISVGPDGGTHQAVEDIALTRVIPRMTVLTPCDALETEKAVLAAAVHKGPVYIRLAREKTPTITTSETPFEIGRALPIYIPKNPAVTFFSCGSILSEVFGAIEELKKKDIAASLVHISTVKPLDISIVSIAEKAEKVVVVEEHQRAGGLGSAIAEMLSEHAPRPILRLGIADVFGQSGTPEELIKYHQLDAQSVATRTIRFLKY